MHSNLTPTNLNFVGVNKLLFPVIIYSHTLGDVHAHGMPHVYNVDYMYLFLQVK